MHILQVLNITENRCRILRFPGLKHLATVTAKNRRPSLNIYYS